MTRGSPCVTGAINAVEQPDAADGVGTLPGRPRAAPAADPGVRRTGLEPGRERAFRPRNDRIVQEQRMSSVKRAVLDLVKGLPDSCTLEDVQYQLYVRQKVERSMEAAAAGRVQSHEQVKKRLSKWLAR